MDNFQVSLINIFILVLWGIIVPCLSISIYLFASSLKQRKNTRKAIAYLLFAFLLLMMVGFATAYLQTINPPCSGVGSPEQLMCIDYGLTPTQEAIAILNEKILFDLFRTIGIPIGVSLVTGIILIRIEKWRKVQKEKHFVAN